MGILADARLVLLRRRRFLQLLVSGVTGLFFQSRSVKGGLSAQELAILSTNNDLVAERQIVIHNLSSIAHAMLNYHDCYGRFPPAAVYSADGQPLLSWRVLLLPFLRGNDLYGRFQLDEPWDSPHNKQLLGEMPGAYTSPGGRTTERFQTRYQIVTGASTLFARKDGPMISDVRDGVAFTLLIVEAARVVPWTKPDDLVYAADQPLPQFGGLFPDGCYAALVEGTVHYIKKETDEETLRALITPADGKCTRWEPDSSVVYPHPRAPSPKATTTFG